MEESKKAYFHCGCGGEMIVIEVDKDPDFPFVQLAFYDLGHQGNLLSWKHRLRCIWRVLTKGTPYSDMVILYPGEWEKFRQFIIDNFTSVEEKIV